MSILTRLSSWWASKSGTANPSEWFLDWVRGGQESASGIVVSQWEALRDVVTMACVSIRAADLAKLPVHVMRRRGDGGTEILKGHAVERLLHKPNSWQTKFEFIEMMQAYYLLRSNAYAPVIWNGRGQPMKMIPVNPDRVSLHNVRGELFYQVTRGSYDEIVDLASLPLMISADNVIHLRGMSLNGLTGVSRIGMARDAIGLSLALERYSSSLFARGARPGGTYETDKKLSDATFARLKAQLDGGSYVGLSNAGKSMLLEEGLKWVKQSMTAVESQTVEARRLQIEQVATAFDVPLHRLGVIPEGGGQAILQAHQMYLNNTLSTDAERWENKLNDMFGLDGEETFVQFDLDYFNRADIQTRLNAYGTAVTRSIYTVNEARRREGLADDPDGNIIFAPANMVALGVLSNPPQSPSPKKPSGPGSDTTGTPAAGGDGDPAAVPSVEGD